MGWVNKPEVAKKFLKIYLYRGFIGLPKSIKEHAKCLGLRKRFQTVYKPVDHPSVGNLLKIKELVKVELVDKKPEKLVGPMYPKGYHVIASMLPKTEKPFTLRV